MFHPAFDLSSARPASYNPRRLSDEAAATLRESLSTLGVLKSVVVAPDGLILAGHQRTNQMAQIGLTTAPAMVLSNAVDERDQARFNQLHNRCDLDFSAADFRIKGTWHAMSLRTGWQWIEPQNIEGRAVGYASERREMCVLLAKYGPWGNGIISEDGRILVGGLYAACCALLRVPLLACVISSEQEMHLERFFGRSYGEFSYAHFERTTWVQGMAQMYRLRGPKIKSRTYENLVIPRLRPGLRILDFGAGQMDYVKALRAQGVDIRGVEFYFRDGNSIDVTAVHRQIDALCHDLHHGGLFDLVIADSVLNSVDSQQAEDDVLACCHAFCRPGGTVIWSGRSREEKRLVATANHKKRTGKGRTVEFFDDNGFSALPRGDKWHFQKFHTLKEVEAQAARYFGPEFEIFDNDGNPALKILSRSAWGAVATKTASLDDSEILSALAREFDLPLPDGSSYRRGGDIVSAYQAAL